MSNSSGINAIQCKRLYYIRDEVVNVWVVECCKVKPMS